LEATDSEEATHIYKTVGEEDPFGAKAWPTAYIVATRLLSEGVTGRSVLELGCGTGLVSIAALSGGAAFVLATDRAQPNIDNAKASARLNGVELHAELFDVLLPCPLPSSSSQVCGSLRNASYTPECASMLPAFFDFLVFSDVLYWPKEAAAFGRRAAQAYAAGSTVLVADPGRRRDDFLSALRDELILLRVEPLPVLELKPAIVPAHVYEFVSEEVRTASKLFCGEPFELILRPPSSRFAQRAPEAVHNPVWVAGQGSFEVVD